MEQHQENVLGDDVETAHAEVLFIQYALEDMLPREAREDRDPSATEWIVVKSAAPRRLDVCEDSLRGRGLSEEEDVDAMLVHELADQVAPTIDVPEQEVEHRVGLWNGRRMWQANSRDPTVEFASAR